MPFRYCLNFKNIPYTTEWVELGDIEAHCKKLGIAPTSKRRDGSPLYTLPAIYDPSTNIYLADSLAIARYLEKQYPDTRPIFPHSSGALHLAFTKALLDEIDAVTPFVVPGIYAILSPATQAYFRRTREVSWGKKLEEIAPQGKDKVVRWVNFRNGLGNVDEWFAMNGGGPFVMGDTLSWSDIILASELSWFRATWGEHSSEWKDILSWHEGRWETFVGNMKEYETVI